MHQDTPDIPSNDASVLCALFLGRIQAGLEQSCKATLRLLAARLIRETLIAALRQEGHVFTEARFFEWFAGLRTLSEVPAHNLRPPRALCQAILGEFGHSRWRELAHAAERLSNAFFAPSDFNRGSDHEDVHAVIDEARSLIAGLEAAQDGLPFRTISALFTAAAASPRFARAERDLELLRGAHRDVAVERQSQENARWALDMLAGSALAPGGGLPLPLPLPGLVALPVFGLDGPDSGEPPLPVSASSTQAVSALREALWRIDGWLRDADMAASRIAHHTAELRSSGRSRTAAEFIVGFGTLRGTQLETLLEATRHGVRIIAATLADLGLVASEAGHNATRLYSYAAFVQSSSETPAASETFAFSETALDEFQSSMDALDDLLRRTTSKNGDATDG